MKAHRTLLWLMGALLLGWSPLGGLAQEDDAPVIRSRRLDEPQAETAPAQPAVAHAAVIRLGVAPAMIDSRGRVEKVAKIFGEVGARVVKNYPWHAEWGQMQRKEKSRIDFDQLDRFVGKYQAAGFEDIMICLRANSRWASREYDKKGSPNPTPKPEYQDAFSRWIGAIVERYDGDGAQDMKGLLRPVHLYEIGAQFSEQEPGPAEDYVEMLRLAHGAAHLASPQVLVAHAGFVTTGAFVGNPGPDAYEAAFADSPLVYHKLPAIRSLLDAHASFDLVNLHALGDPRELDAMVEWIRYEMERRDIDKPIIIGETTPSPFITRGAATDCNLPPDQMGIVVAPARESDRCRLAAYFSNLVLGDNYSELWAHRYAAADMVKKVVIAASHDLALINTSSMEDLDWQQRTAFRAATGNAAWAGMLDLRGEGRPGLFALKQLASRLRTYDDIKRLKVDDETVVIYQVTSGQNTSWIAWLEPDALALPRDPSPRVEVDLPVSMSTVLVERMIEMDGQVSPVRNAVIPIKGILPVVLRPYPTYIFSQF